VIRVKGRSEKKTTDLTDDIESTLEPSVYKVKTENLMFLT